MKVKLIIDTFKGLTGIMVLSLMAFYNQWANPTAWVYLALHGSYGILWVMKSKIFPDKAWEEKVSVSVGLISAIILSLYWVGPWLLAARNVHAPLWYLSMCIALYACGVFFHFSADMQKYQALKYRPGLITDELFALCRNPNYFGELLIYLSFALLPMHWLPLAILAFSVVILWVAFSVVILWVPRMLKKDRSLARYPEFEDYRKKTALLIPYLL